MSFARFRLSVAMVAVAGSLVAAPVASADTPGRESLLGLTDASAERALVGDLVAAAKFGTPAPIDDPAREQVVLDNVRTLSAQLGVDADVAVAVFRDEIEANKIVQRGLYALWTEHPELVPTEKPDLVKTVRPILDRITGELLEQIKETSLVQQHPSCQGRLTAAKAQIAHTRHLDTLHRTALARATASVCR